MKNNALEFPRGDTFAFKFQRLDWEGNVIKELPTSLYFTVKKNYKTTDKMFQKSLGNGITYTEEDNTYHVLIDSEDTRELRFGEYVYDLQVMVEDVVTTIAIDTLTLSEEVTQDYV